MTLTKFNEEKYTLIDTFGNYYSFGTKEEMEQELRDLNAVTEKVKKENIQCATCYYFLKCNKNKLDCKTWSPA